MERNKAVQWRNKYAFTHAPVNDSLVDDQFVRVQVPPPALLLPHNNAPAVPAERVIDVLQGFDDEVIVYSANRLA
jgi:hypothetical protein